MHAATKSAVIAVCLALSTPVAVAKPVQPPSLIDIIATWLEANFDLPSTEKLPTLATLPAAELVEIRYGPGSTVAPGEVVAAYDDDTQTIYLAEGWTGRSPAQLSVLVHEMVHHLQASADMRFACPGEREVVAFRAQEAWLELFGQDLESAFGIDRAMLLFATVCTH
jgi:hypothetical protein